MSRIFLPASNEELLSLCEVETFRSSGSGGQHVNKTDSAVRLTYSLYNLAVTCQEGRSQYQNKVRCLEKLREKIEQLNYRAPKRIPTRISKGTKEKNLEKKAKHGQKKKLRSKVLE